MSSSEPTRRRKRRKPIRKRTVDKNRLTGDTMTDLSTSVYKLARDSKNRIISIARSDLLFGEDQKLESEKKRWLMALVRAYMPKKDGDEVVFVRWAYLCFWHGLECFFGLILATYIVVFSLTSTMWYLEIFKGYYTTDDIVSIGVTGLVSALLSAAEVVASVKCFYANSRRMYVRFLEVQMTSAMFSLLFVGALFTIYVLNSMEAEEIFGEMKTSEAYESYISDNDVRTAIDDFQRSNKCCGISDFQTWSQIRWTVRNVETYYDVPTSCCSVVPCKSRGDVEFWKGPRRFFAIFKKGFAPLKYF